jgi:hypothetical protein
LASYTVDALEPTPILKESVPGSGGLCGSSFLNRIFASYLDDKFEGFPRWDDDCKNEALRVFENDIKPAFTGRDTDNRSIRLRGLPDNARRGIKDGWLEIAMNDLREKIFDPVIHEIRQLVDDQIKKTKKHANPRKVLLAGGFGRNEYLRHMLQQFVGKNMKVVQVEERYCRYAIGLPDEYN